MSKHYKNKNKISIPYFWGFFLQKVTFNLFITNFTTFIAPVLISENTTTNNEGNMIKTKKDHIQETIGDMGKWQIFVCAVIFLLKFPVAWHQMSIIFLGKSNFFIHRLLELHFVASTQLLLLILNVPMRVYLTNAQKIAMNMSSTQVSSQRLLYQSGTLCVKTVILQIFHKQSLCLAFWLVICFLVH